MDVCLVLVALKRFQSYITNTCLLFQVKVTGYQSSIEKVSAESELKCLHMSAPAASSSESEFPPGEIH